MRPHIMAIAGGSGSGKTTLVRMLTERRSDSDILVIPMDHYYKDLSHLSMEERDLRNFDHPDALDLATLGQHLSALRQGQSVDRPTYDFASHTRSKASVRLTPRKAIILDGILSLHDPALRMLLDLSVYIDVDDDVRFIRRLRRDTMERGRTMDSVIRQYLASVKSMHDAYVAPQKHVADIIVSWMEYNERAVAMLSHMMANWFAH